MSKLPARPNLEHLRTQAKALLSKLRSGDLAAARTFIKYLPEAASLTPKQVRAAGYRLADAQSAVARKSGFGEWPALARHVERLRSLEGTWAFRALQTDGQTMPAEMIASSRLLLDGDRFRMESPEAIYEGVFTIDIEHMPHRIDVDFNEGPEAGNRCEGLFDLEGDQLIFCFGLVGTPRPKEFAAPKNSGCALERLERVERARPAGVDGGSEPAPVPPVPMTPPAEFETSVTATIAKLQGEWTPVELIQSGQPLQESYLPYGRRTHEGVETKVIFGGQNMLHANMRVNEATEPLEIDYVNLAGKQTGAVSMGLFKWDGDQAVFCVATPGAPRPSSFDPTKGVTLSRWKRS